METAVLDRRHEESREGFGGGFWRRLPMALWERLTSLRRSVRGWTVPAAVTILLSMHAVLLAYAATRHSPTLNEPGHLVAGLSYWEFGRFDVYRVNPPLTRLVAALPVLAAGYEMDWSRFYNGPGARPEFVLGADFIKANGERSIWLFTIARWACIPISLIGGLFCFLWGRELYGTLAGLASLTLWCTDPNILAHAELITPDAAATAFGIGASYAFWRWLKEPTWGRALAAGLLLGLTQLSKMIWLFLFGLWPFLWFAWQANRIRQPSEPSRRHQLLQLAGSLLLGLYILNVAYLFDGSFTPLKDFSFVSETLAGEQDAGRGGNRFALSWLGELLIPLPKQYLLGLDSQKRDLEDYGEPSYLGGDWRNRGWWHYYLYGCLVKIPHGTQALLLLAFGLTARRTPLLEHSRREPGRPRWSASWRDELVLLAPAFALFTLVSIQTEFNHHFRYVLPSLGLLLVFLGKTISSMTYGIRSILREQHLKGCVVVISGSRCTLAQFALAFLLLLCLASSVISSWRVRLHSLAYFNELAGGPENGWRHMLHSSQNWGEDLLFLKQWSRAHPEANPLFIHCNTMYDTKNLGIHATSFREDLEVNTATSWYAVSTMKLQRKGLLGPVPLESKGLVEDKLSATLRDRAPVARIGYSLYVFHVTENK